MSNFGLLRSIVYLATLAIPTRGNADCVPDYRQVEVGSRGQIVRVRSYACPTDRNGGTALRVEFYRLSAFAAGMLVAGDFTPFSKNPLHDAKLIENAVLQKYLELLEKFGTTLNLKADDTIEFRMVPAGDGNTVSEVEKGLGRQLRTVTGWYFGTQQTWAGIGTYPLSAEIAELRSKKIPRDFHYFVSADKLSDCKDDGTHWRTTMWRSLRSNDVANYASNARTFNQQLAEYKTQTHTHQLTEEWDRSELPLVVPRLLTLFDFVTGQQWPDDFAVLESSYDPEANCGGEAASAIAGWGFIYRERTILLDVMLLENTGAESVHIDGLFGIFSRDTRLRPTNTKPNLTPSDAALIDFDVHVAPGERIVLPTRITFPAPDRECYGECATPGRTCEQAVRESVDRAKIVGFEGDAEAYRPALVPRDYDYGPSVALAGLRVGGNRENFERTAASFMDLASSLEAGSCPYLMSWDVTKHSWADHGKVLHEGHGSKREYEESIPLPEVRTRFRIEEREREVASLNSLELALSLKNGDEVLVRSNLPSLRNSDDSYERLFWNEALEVHFDIPAAFAGQVVAARIQIAGFYDRYSPQGID